MYGIYFPSLHSFPSHYVLLVGVLDLENPGQDDFELWSPAEVRSEMCLFGRQVCLHSLLRIKHSFSLTAEPCRHFITDVYVTRTVSSVISVNWSNVLSRTASAREMTLNGARFTMLH